MLGEGMNQFDDHDRESDYHQTKQIKNYQSKNYEIRARTPELQNTMV
jgi:hypothetical protein